ncbi:MAG: Ribosomal large subunit pseudouridine synthase D [Deltaproteobacteria bacterium ADurb.Bin510]|nr:MAG: Ribosomal large subunit pseudouridine synthase D [Deltaproteobacteria bacterium ADurb.Bin510]
MQVVYEDNHLLAVNKPAGVLTQPSPTESASLETQAKAWLKDKYAKPGQVYLHAVHRLDKVTSGLVLFAKTDKSLSRLNQQMRGRSIVKIYHAVVTGQLPASAGELCHNLQHARLHTEVVDDGKPARLSYRLLKQAGDLSLVEIDLQTGRYHQIRAQLAAVGCPVLGDERYGGRPGYAAGAVALHHKRMRFTHPVTKAELELEAPYPADWPLLP